MHGQDDPQAARFAQVLSDAICRKGLRLDELRDALRAAGSPVSLATLSYWRSGRSTPARERSLRAVEQLEHLLNLSSGQLTGALPNDAMRRWDVVKAAGVPEQGMALLDAMGLQLQGQLTNEFLHDSVQAGADGIQLERTVQLFRSEVEGLDRIPIAFRFHPDRDEAPLAQAVSGCEVGRVVMLDDEGLMAIEILLSQPVPRGERHLLEYTLRWEYPPGDGVFSRVLPQPLETYVMEANLEVVPERVEYFSTPNSYQPGRSDDDIPVEKLEPRRHAQRVILDAPAGLHSIRWAYGPEGNWESIDG
ncbi:hypothetical protein [Luteococcus sp. OSA5]|uniref:hypothetical protein n=1 Tax=Luteococcus sp. OSA5 TaxID=3401630 RepID=UPI003B42F441